MTAFWTADLSETLSSARRVVNAATGTRDIENWLRAYDITALPSTNTGAADLAFQRWMKFKEAFSPKFVVDALASLDRPPTHCIDPFGGSGTTALTCSLLGVRCTTTEVNPFLADLIEAKVTPLRPTALADAYVACVDAAEAVDPGSLSPGAGAPASLREPGVGGRFVFWSEAMDRILALRAGLMAVDDEDARRMLRVLLGSILIEASNVVVNGKGRRYRGGWMRRRVTADQVDRLFDDAVARAARDLKEFSGRTRADVTIIRGDTRVRLDDAEQADVAVFSPPYPNSFDYTDVYNLELWMLGYLDDSASNRALRLSTLRSHVQVSWSPGGSDLGSPTLALTLLDLDRVRHRLWNPNLVSMVEAYFQDMAVVLSKLRDKLAPGGKAIMVAGDSRYGDVRVDVGSIMAEVGTELG
ncbi:site-specific DNA-methyltransferase [Sphingomonas aracearum]|uniref:site-specific DNA-methyltransferase n=1 Tax=Sphingomonas aracearum TaxID=2283317 RepID=UPI0011C033EC|nr:site-specific DNA-methyltransferase [Sphingomonas aracearum]